MLMTKWHHSVPARITPPGSAHYDIRAGDGTFIALVYSSLDGDMDTFQTACLIAEAPETAAERDRLKELNSCMLEALKNLENDNGTMMPASAWALVQNAIRKAEGEQL